VAKAKSKKTGNRKLAPPPLIPNDPGPNLGATGSPGYSDPLNLPTGQYGVFGDGWNSPYPIVPPLHTGDYGIFGDALPTNLPPLQGHLPASSAGSPRAMLPYGAALPLPAGPGAGDAQWVSPPNGPQQWQGGPPTFPTLPASGWGGLRTQATGPLPTGWGGLEGVSPLPPMIPKTPLEQYVAAIQAAEAGGSTYTGHNYVPPPMPATGWGGLDAGPPVTHRQQWQGTGPLQRGPQQWQGTGVKPPVTGSGTPSGFDAKGNKMPAASKYVQGQLGNNGRQGSGMTGYNKAQEIVGTLATQLADMTGTSPDAWLGHKPEELVAAISAQTKMNADNANDPTGSNRAAAAQAAAAAAAKQQAIQQYLGELDKNRSAQQGALDQQFGAINAGYDAAGTQLGSLNQQAADRQAGIMSGLNAQAVTGRADTAAAYQAGDKRLADLQAQYATQQTAQQAGSDRLTGAFGAPQAYGGGSAANDMFAAGRAQNAMMGTGADTAFTDRSNVYNALGADASTARGNQFDVLMTKLKLQQQQSAAAQAKANADLASQYNDRRLSVYG